MGPDNVETLPLATLEADAVANQMMVDLEAPT